MRWSLILCIQFWIFKLVLNKSTFIEMLLLLDPHRKRRGCCRIGFLSLSIHQSSCLPLYTSICLNIFLELGYWFFFLQFGMIIETQMKCRARFFEIILCLKNGPKLVKKGFLVIIENWFIFFIIWSIMKVYSSIFYI